MPVRKLMRSGNDRKLAGICGGIGEMFSVDPLFVRLIFVFLAILTGIVPLIIVYIIGWLVIPEQV